MGIPAAIGAGFTAEKILEFLMRRSPQMKNKISKSLAAGFSADKILKFFSNDRNFQKLKDEMEQEYPLENNANPIVQAQNVRSRNLGSDMASGLQRNVGPILGTAASAGASYALGRALPKILQSGQQAPSLTSASQAQMQTPLGIQVPQTSQPPSNIGSNVTIPQQTLPAQVELKNINPTDLLNKHGLTKHVDELAKRQKDPKAIAGILYAQFPKEMQAFQKEAGKNMEEAIGDYLQTKSNTEEIPKPNESIEEQKVPNLGGMAKGMTDNLYSGLFEALQQGKTKFAGIEDPLLKRAKPLFDKGKIKSAEDLRKFANEKSPIAKNETVASPQGLGEVKEIRNGKALIDVDGKLHKVSVEELESESKDIANLYDDLFNAIPDEYKSRMMNYAGYDEEHNELIFRPHGGAAYVYKEIPSEFANELKNRLHRAKTTGKNMYGMWYEGDQSYGAGMSKLIKELQTQYGGKGKEYVRKYNTLFDILGIPHEEKKRKEREERERRKRNG